MDKTGNSRGSSTLAVVLVLETVLFLGVLVFALSSYSGEQKSKTNVNGQIATAVAAAVQKTQATDQQNYAEQSKDPLTNYTAPEVDGSLSVYYPKTWSAYIDTTGSGGGEISGYFAPNYVPATGAQTSVYALRFELLQQPYDQAVTQFNNQSSANGQAATISAYALPKVPSVVGIMVNGYIGNQKNGIMVVLPLRGNTLEIWTEAPQYENDFTTSVLPNASFSP